MVRGYACRSLTARHVPFLLTLTDGDLRKLVFTRFVTYIHDMLRSSMFLTYIYLTIRYNDVRFIITHASNC